MNDTKTITVKTVMLQDGKFETWERSETSRQFFMFNMDEMLEMCHGKPAIFIATIHYYNAGSMTWDTETIIKDFRCFEDRDEVRNDRGTGWVRYHGDESWYGLPPHDQYVWVRKPARILGTPMDDFMTRYLVEIDGERLVAHKESLDESGNAFWAYCQAQEASKYVGAPR